jgi:nitrate reductase cytochrome c-type subunit
VLKKPAAVPARHGKTIVPWKYCNSCHWEKHDDFPDAPKITGSRMHSKHYFDQQIECTICHGYIVHEFTPEPQFCVKCHQGKEVHGTGMEKLACLNCHTDRTVDLRPDRAKCLYCHGSEQMRKELVEAGTIDVRHYQPEQKLVRQATKIKLTSDAPMQFFCYQCHKPHEEKIRPGKDHCIKCHRNAPAAGKHPIHVQTMGMDCKECHRPHLWRVTPEQAKKDCVKCHAYKDPKLFLSMGEGAVATGEKLAKKNPCEEGTGRGPGYKAFDCP